MRNTKPSSSAWKTALRPLVSEVETVGAIACALECNHGSLSDRIMNRYGDSPEGWWKSALEFVRLCRKKSILRHHPVDEILQPQSDDRGLSPLGAAHGGRKYGLSVSPGVTEAGYGEDGRIKSAIGIGSLLNDGIGDTIRVSLTEDPEYEVPVAADCKTVSSRPGSVLARERMADRTADA